MKKLDTLKKMLENTEAEALNKMLIAIAENEAVTNSIDALSKREQLALLQFAELEKALKNNKYTLVLDINYSQSRAKEINLYTDLEISWEPITKGRKVIQITFYITERDKNWGNFRTVKMKKQIDGQMNFMDYTSNNQITITG